MKSLSLSKTTLSAIVLLAVFCMQPGTVLGAVLADACSEGVGIPPFLSSGADPNLLLLLDNSGSMLDMAYSDEDNRCFDDTYDSNVTYAGYFENDEWYQWTEGSYASWKNGIAYSIGDRVYAYGIIWAAQSAGTSNGTTIDDDQGVVWEHVFDIGKWANDTDYAAGSFIWSGPQLYYTELGGHSNDPDNSDGLNLADDTGVTWTEVDSTWQNGTLYSAGDIVTYKGIYYQAAGDNSSSGTSLYDDIGVTWNRMNEGSYVTTDKTSALAHCSAATGTHRSHSDLCVTLDEGVIPQKVTAFAARGNFFNWAMASKFDIQKEILTGGKYNYYDDLMVSEHRGCAGSRFIKQVKFDDGYHLTLGIRGSKYDDDPVMEDRIDSADDVGRLEILAITQSGYQASQECIDALAYILEHGLNGSQSKITACTDTFPASNSELADQNPVLNHSLQFCWQLENHQRNMGNIISECEHLYTGWHVSRAYLPSELVPAYGAYICYGIFDSNLDHVNRTGYIGRCWDPAGSGGATTCDPKGAVSNVDGGCDGEGCEYGAEPDMYKNENGYNYKCTAFLSGACKTHVQDVVGNRKYWELQYVWSDGSGSCSEGDAGSGATGAGWEDTWDSNPNFNDPDNCILQASIDYCNDMKVPEVIDPSDEAGNTTDYWNIPGLLTDSELIAQLGVTHPLAVMKGYIQRSDRPEGVLHQVAGDIRFGAMAFNNVGAATECKPENLTSGIEKYCPKNNKDGAELIASIEQGSLVVDSNDTTYASGERRHVDDLAESINAIRATSWTPLAEAMFGALGYFTQNSSLCLNKDLNGDCLDLSIANNDDPVEYWCQENHILVITEGESTADINSDVSSFINDPVPYFGSTPYPDDDTGGDDDGDNTTTACDSLKGSTYLDDMAWWGYHVGPLYAARTIDDSDGVAHDKQNITSHFVITGSLGTDGTGECSPAVLMQHAANNSDTTLYTGEDPAQLEANLRAALSDIMSRASAGSAASVISSSRSGEGAVYQAIFWPRMDRGIGNDPLAWTGDVHAFFIDGNGFLWDDYSGNHDGTDADSANIKGALWSEDINGNGILELETGEDTNNNGVLDGDRRIITYYNENTNTTRICFNSSVVVNGVCAGSDYYETADIDFELRDFDQYLWSANDQLKIITNTAENRAVNADGTWNFANKRRYIFTWNDLDNDGIVDTDLDDDGIVDDDGEGSSDTEEVLAFVEGMNTGLTVTGSRHGVLQDYNVADDTELNGLIKWLRGDNVYEVATDGVFTPYDPTEDINNNGVQDWVYRCRRYPDCDPTLNALDNPVWRLGDVIHSTPTLAARPPEGYHYAYSDPQYATFYKTYLGRRHVVYFGGNDGMLHAVNAGFFLAGQNRFLTCPEDQRSNNECVAGNHYAALGEELWAYVPYNLQPHLSCLSDQEYSHKYFVDAPPRLFDVRSFPDDAVHPGGWGTILVGYMRFGGAPLLADDSATPPADNRKFISSYFILDVTDPERPPKLLAEMTTTTDTYDYDGDGTAEDMYIDLGYTTSMPTAVAMRNDLGHSEWFLILGNGPTTIKGENDQQQGKVAVVPLSAITGVNWKVNGNGTYSSTERKPFRIPNEDPPGSTAASPSISHFGRWLIPASTTTGDLQSFVSDMVTLDFDIGDPGFIGVGVPYKSDVVYFGTVDGSGFFIPDPVLNPDKTIWNGGGRMYRLVTNVFDSNGDEKYSYPEEWYLAKFLDANAPITAAANVGYDGSNFWVYFGTGRFFAPEDKTDDTTQYFFGVKEPLDTSCSFSWGEVDWLSSGTNPATSSGYRGLLRTDQYRVVEKGSTTLFNGTTDYFYCDTCAVVPLTQLPGSDGDGAHGYYSFDDLKRYIAGESCGATDDTTIGIDGWYRELYDLRERALGMPTLLGGLVTYTGYQPFSDICKAEGNSFLYGVYYITGTAWYESVFGTDPNGDAPQQKNIVRDRLGLGKGLATTPSLQVGTADNAATAYIQTSTGEIVEVGQENLPLDNTRSGRKSWSDR